MKNLAGVLTVLHTPYNEDYSVDWAVFEEEIGWVFEVGADGVVAAMVTEILRLTWDERKQLAQFLPQVVAGRGPVVMSVGAESTYAAVELARHAQGCGVDALMAIPPVSIALGESQIRAYYAAIIEATQIPLVVQDASSYVGAPMSAGFQAQLAREWGERVAFKPEAAPVGPVISELHELAPGAQIFEGSGGAALVENFRRGVAGTMPGVDILDALVALWRALQGGDEDRIYQITPLVAAISALAVNLDGYLAVEKHLMHKRGIFKNQLVRGPVGFHLDEPMRAELDRLFTRLQDVLK